MEQKTNLFFDVISHYPDSQPSLLDIQQSLSFYPVIIYFIKY
jgi:hypothetical protein